MKLVVACLLAVLISFGSCQLRFPQMYEISTRPWLYSLSQRYSRSISRLADIPDQEFTALKNQGYDVIWMMGVWQLGKYGLNYDKTNPQLLAHYPTVLPDFTLDDVIGSPYAVVDYTCNPDIGSDADLANLKRKLNGMGLKLMLDFVPNHSAVDSPWTSSNIDYYIRAASRNPPYDSKRYLSNGIAYGWAGWGDSWQDTAQYNYWNMNFRQVMTGVLSDIASVADYIRCDMAFLLLNDNIKNIWGQQLAFWNYQQPSTEFWGDAIAKVKAAHPQVQFLAEVYNPWEQNLQNLGFDFTYDKSLYDQLASRNLDNIRNYITSKPVSFLEHSAHFVENHDEPRAAAFFGSNMVADAATIVSMTLPGMRFYNSGQEQGYANRLDIHLRRAASESPHVGVPEFYNKFVSIISRPIFHSGTWQYLSVGATGDSWRLMGWKWVLNNQKVLIVVNFSDTQASGNVVLSDATPQNGNDTIPFTELFSGVVYERSVQTVKSTGLFVVIPAWSAQIFEYS